MIRRKLAMLVGGLGLLTLVSGGIFYFTIQSLESRFQRLVEVNEPVEVTLLESMSLLEESYSAILDYAGRASQENKERWERSREELHSKIGKVRAGSPSDEFTVLMDRISKQSSQYISLGGEISEISDQQSGALAELGDKIRNIGMQLKEEISAAEMGKAGLVKRLDLLLRMKANIDKTFFSIDAYLAFRETRLRKEASEAMTDFTRNLKELRTLGAVAFSGRIGGLYAEAALLAAEIMDREDLKESKLEELRQYRSNLGRSLEAELLPLIRENLRQSMLEASLRSHRAKIALYVSAAAGAALALFALSALWQIMSSLSHISEGVERIGRGDFDHKLALTGKDELGELSNAFNEMISRRKSAEEALVLSGEKYRNLFEYAHDGIIIFDIDSRRIIEANEIAALRLGYTKAEFERMLIDDIVHPRFDARVDIPMQKLREGESVIYERVHRRKDGSLMPVEVSAKRFDYGGRQVIQAVVRDMTRRKEAERELKLASSVFETAMEGVIVTDRDSVIQFVNPAFTKITGYEAAEVIGKKPSILRSEVNDKEFYQVMWASLLTTGQWRGEIWNRHKSGRVYPEWLTISAIKDAEGKTTQYAAVFHDITDMKRNEDEIKYQAFHDPLTGLPNRLLFRDRLKHAIDKGHRENAKVAVLFLDLDDFKNINDSLGHDFGDMLLKGISVRLISCLREVDTVARIGGDEFVIILEGISREEEAVLAASRIINSLSEPYTFKNESLFCTTSVGITMFPADGTLAEELIKNADLAMYHAKGLGKNNYQFFDRSMNDKVVKRMETEKNIRRAIEKDLIICHFQPRMDILSGSICGLEALARWIDGGKTVSAVEFIEVAEESNLIFQISDIVMLNACWSLKNMLDSGYVGLSLAVNVSVKQMERRKLIPLVKMALERTGLDGKFLELELKESAVLKDIDLSIKTMKELTEMGVSIVIDDFGTGYSSLFQLKKLPLKSLKIDRSFVNQILKSRDDAAIAKATISMGHDLGLKVIAEGVETLDQLEYLKSIGCDEVQGYLVSRPMATEDMADFFSERMKIQGKPGRANILSSQ